MNRDLGAGFDVHRRERLAIELVHPLRHVLDATGEMRPIASLPEMPTVPSEPLLLATTATLPLSDLISDAAPAPAAVISA